MAEESVDVLAWQRATSKTRGSDTKWQLWVASSLNDWRIPDLQLSASGVWIDMPMKEEDKLYAPLVPYCYSTPEERFMIQR